MAGHRPGATVDPMTTTTTTAESGYVDLDGVRTYHEITGAGDPLVLLHGGMCTIDTFGELAASLASGYRVHRPERRGHGRTADVPGPITYDNMATDTVAYLERLGVAPAHLVGWSDGAVVALLVALTRPDLVRTLVVIGTAITEDGLPPEMLPLPDRIPIEALPPFLREMYAEVSSDGPDHFDVVFEKLSPAWTALPYVELSELPRVAAPTLVMAGDHDMVTPEHAAAIARAIPQGRLAVVPGDHSVPLEKPGLVGDLVLDFIGGVGAGV
jgi:pimeloyl-ACP methyl ester carboxylesterase